MNTFKIGDTVKLLKSSYDFSPFAWRMYDGYVYSTVTHVVGDQIVTTEDSKPTHYSHFELYKEPSEDVMNKQTQQKTKRIPFNPSLGDAAVFTKLGNHLVKEWHVFSTGVVATLCENFLHTTKHDQIELEMEVPITTKRIPFNPGLKGTKVFYGKTELIEWFYLRTGLVCGTYEWVAAFKGMESLLYHPSDLEMEIDEEG